VRQRRIDSGSVVGGRSPSRAAAGLLALLAGASAIAQNLPLGVPPREPPLRPDRLVRASIEPAAAVAPPGGEAEVAVVLAVEPKWHIYWENPGDSGVPPELEWQLPEGVTAAPPRWPRPMVFQSPHETSFGYEGEAGLVVALRIAADLAEGEHPIRVRVRWMACREQCLVGISEARGTLRIVAADRLAEAAEVPPAVARWRSRLPLARWPGFESRIDPPAGGGPPGSGVLRLRGESRGHGLVRFIPADTPGVRYGGRIPAPAVIEGDQFEIAVPIEIRPGDSLGGPLRAGGLVLFGEESDDPSLELSLLVPRS
jgi:hypothetical protein